MKGYLRDIHNTKLTHKKSIVITFISDKTTFYQT